MRDLFKLAGLRILFSFLSFFLLLQVERLTIPIFGNQQMGQRNLKTSPLSENKLPFCRAAQLHRVVQRCAREDEEKKGNAAALKGFNWNFGPMHGHTLIDALKMLGLRQNGSKELWVFYPR